MVLALALVLVLALALAVREALALSEKEGASTELTEGLDGRAHPEVINLVIDSNPSASIHPMLLLLQTYILLTLL